MRAVQEAHEPQQKDVQGTDTMSASATGIETRLFDAWVHDIHSFREAFGGIFVNSPIIGLI
jgi:hypothetical protein